MVLLKIKPFRYFQPSSLTELLALIPTAMDALEVDAIIVENDEPTGPFGAKGVGEASNIATAPAIINATHDAVGIRIRELPVTPEKILVALREVVKRG